MEFRIADTFTDSLARLTGDEQKAVKTTAFDQALNDRWQSVIRIPQSTIRSVSGEEPRCCPCA